MIVTQPTIKASPKQFLNPHASFAAKVRTRVAAFARHFRNSHSTIQAVEPLFRDRDSAFSVALAAVRQREWSLAERELTNGNGHRALSDARCLNLLGVVCESTCRWSEARRCYTRAIRADKRFQAPQINICRYYELNTFGRTQLSVRFGDEGDVQS